MTEMSTTDIAVAFIETMVTNDMDAAAGYLAADVTFQGPLTRFTTAESYVQALGEFSRAVDAINVLATIGDADGAVVMHEMVTAPFGTVQAMEYFTIHNGKIRTDQLVFDTHAVRTAMSAEETST